jgi:hypothetical protein
LALICNGHTSTRCTVRVRLVTWHVNALKRGVFIFKFVKGHVRIFNHIEARFTEHLTFFRSYKMRSSIYMTLCWE